MATIAAFRGVTYNKDRVSDMVDVVAPPYDIIPPDMQDILYRRHPYNIVRLILGKIRKNDNTRDNRYARARGYFEAWLKNRIMVQDKRKAIYIYSQRYNDGKKDVERTGFIGLLRLNKSRRERALSHENTGLAPKLDRLNLIRAVKANLSPIFVLYEDNSHAVLNVLKKICLKMAPFIDIDFDEARHRAWRMEDIRAIKRIESLMRPKDIFIADGHHRYEVALTYSVEIQDKSRDRLLKRNSRYMMAYFVTSDDKMLTVLAAHRLVKDIGMLKKGDIKRRLEKFFYMDRTPDVEHLISKLRRLSNSHAFGMYLGKRDLYILKMKSPKFSDRIIKNSSLAWKRLDATILHLFILEYVLGIRDDDDNVEFAKDARAAVRLIDSGKLKLAFFLNPTKVSQVKRIARLGERMPRKATYFYPKPLSGLVINKLY